eukprot:m51a1_g13409 hypothetical protein (129) ;mRNA; f:1137-2000
MAEPPLRKVTTIADVANNADGVMRVAFIGASGCGKSTTINALLATDAEKSALSGPAQCRDPGVNNGTMSRVIAYISGSQGCTLIDTVGFTDPCEDHDRCRTQSSDSEPPRRDVEVEVLGSRGHHVQRS